MKDFKILFVYIIICLFIGFGVGCVIFLPHIYVLNSKLSKIEKDFESLQNEYDTLIETYTSLLEKINDLESKYNEVLREFYIVESTILREDRGGTQEVPYYLSLIHI